MPDFAAEMDERIDVGDCIICGSDINGTNPVPIIDITPEHVARLFQQLNASQEEFTSATSTLAAAISAYDQAITNTRQLQAAIVRRTAQMDQLLARLPPEEVEIHKQQSEIVGMRARVVILQRELDEKRASFEEIVSAANRIVVEQATKIEEAFGYFAQEFLIEDCKLTWSPQPARLGQAGRRFDFPAFQLELGGSTFSTPVRRLGPNSVSEIQRAFIDLAFRMALARASDHRGRTSLLMDAPESSLDTVFVDRAAHVLGKFARPETDNRLVVM